MSAGANLQRLGLSLPSDVGPAGRYVSAVKHRDLVHVAGQLPRVDGRVAVRGRVGADVTLEGARQAARIAALRLLAAAVSAAGSIEALSHVIELVVYVRSAPEFGDQSAVADAASELLCSVLEGGGHARTAVGVAELPQGAAVEIAATFALA